MSQQAAVFTVQANAAELRRVVSKLQGYPKPGAHVGGGVHVAMPPTWDGTGQCPPGWTQFSYPLLANTDAVHFAAIVPAQVAADAAIPAKLSLLTAPEQATLSAGVAAVTVLDATWDTAPPLADATAQAAVANQLETP